MKIKIESAQDRFQQYMAWIDEQTAGEPVVGTEKTPEVSLILYYDNYIFSKLR